MASYAFEIFIVLSMALVFGLGCYLTLTRKDRWAEQARRRKARPAWASPEA